MPRFIEEELHAVNSNEGASENSLDTKEHLVSDIAELVENEGDMSTAIESEADGDDKTTWKKISTGTAKIYKTHNTARAGKGKLPERIVFHPVGDVMMKKLNIEGKRAETGLVAVNSIKVMNMSSTALSL